MQKSRSRASLAIIAILGLGVLARAPAFGQQAVQTYPAPGSTAGGNVSGTATGAYVMLWAALPAGPAGGPTRKGCTIINNGTHTMYVTEGYTVGNSLDVNAVPLAAGQAFYCTIFGVTLQGQINLKGTLADTYYAAQY